jgi:NADH-quinone oxidoreductase subunit F
VFALAGKIKKGGLVEFPWECPPDEFFFHCGGIQQDKAFKAVKWEAPQAVSSRDLIDTPSIRSSRRRSHNGFRRYVRH